MPHAMRIAVTGVLSDRPTVLARQLRQQSEQEPAGPASGLHPKEPAGYPGEEPVSLGLPAASLYAVAHGQSLIIRSRHNRRCRSRLRRDRTHRVSDDRGARTVHDCESVGGTGGFGDPTDWAYIFAIATSKPNQLTDCPPFFSKVSLNANIEAITDKGFKVAVAKVRSLIDNGLASPPYGARYQSSVGLALGP